MPPKEEKAAFGVYPQMKPRRRGKSNIGDKTIETLFIPQDPLDLALMAVPYGKAGRAAAAGIMALSPLDAEAGKIKSLTKSLQAMKDELMLKGAMPTQDAPDLSRRSFFGLQPSQDMTGRELTKVERQFAKEDRAPTVTKSTTSVSPDAGKTSRTIEKLVQTPVSRRQVLQTGASQLMQGALPKGALPTPLGGVEEIVQSVAAPAAAASADALIPGLLARALKMGLNEEQAMQFVRSNLPSGVKGAENIDVGTMHYLMQSPFEYAASPTFEGAERLQVMRDILQQPRDASPFQIRGALRSIKSEAPEVYRDLRDVADDIRDYGYEP